MRIQFLLELLLAALYVNNVFALKGLKQNGSLRLLQNGPPIAGTPKESTPTDPKDGAPKDGAPKEGTPKVAEPKMDPKGDVVSKDKKEKKCKKAKATPPDRTSVG